MHEEFSRFEYLWDGTSPEWALLKVDEHSSDWSAYLIVNVLSKAAKIIDDDELASQVVKMMLSQSVTIVSVEDFR